MRAHKYAYILRFSGVLVLHSLVDRFWWFRGTATYVFCSDSSTLTVGWWVFPASCHRLHSTAGNFDLIVFAFVLILLLWYLTLILLTWRMWWAPNNASTWQMGFNSAFKGLSSQVNGHYATWHLCSFRCMYKVPKTDLLLCHVCPAAHLRGTAWLPQDRFSLNFISGTCITICDSSSYLVKSDKSIRHFTCRHCRQKYINDILLKSSGNEESFIIL